jgi:hypothetical protein
MMYRVLALIASAGVLAACGGGSSHALPSSGLASPGSSGSGTQGAQGTARFTLTIPAAGVQVAAKGRTPQYVSASTLSASITANPGNISTTIDLSLASPLCSNVSGGRACTLPVTAPIGSDHFSMVLYSGPCTGGPPCTPTGTPLSAASNFGPITVTEGQTNVTAALVLGGIPTTVDVSAAGFNSGTAATQTLTVTAYDASGNVIVGPAAYVDATGAAAPLSVALGIVPYNGQVAMHDGAQNGTTISVAGPSDATTVQLSSPANVIGIPFVVKNGAQSILAAHAVQMVAVSGTLTATLITTTDVVYQQNYTLYAPMNVNSATGMTDGFVFDFGSQSNGGTIGFFNSDALPAENFNYCFVPGALADAGVSPIDGGIAFAYSAGLFVDTNPWGLNWLPRADFNSSACPAGNPYETDTLGSPDSVVRSMAYDPVGHTLFTGGDSSTIEPANTTVNPSLRYDAFSGAAFSANAILANNLVSSPTSLIDYRGNRYYLLGNAGSNVYAQTGTSAPLTMNIAGTALSNIVSGYDGRVYALDRASRTVYAWNGTSAPVRYTAGSFGAAPSGQPWQMAIGPDGTAFASTATRTVENLPISSASTPVTIPTVSGNGVVDAVFDGTNGYVYAVVDDAVDNGTMNIVRISR